MSTAAHLATIDLLCARAFPAQRGPAEGGAGLSGPGYHVAELRAAGAAPDRVRDAEAERGAVREMREEQCEAERDALSALLARRLGRPQVFGLQGVLLRALEYDEDIPEPWAALSAQVPDVHVWRTAGRWLALGVARLDPARPPRLLAAVTDVDPP